MGNLISIFITSLIGENVVLSKFLGLCPFIGNSGNRKNAVGMGLSVMIVITLSSIITYFINYYLLVPTNSGYLQTLIFILVISSFVQILDILMKRFIPSLHKALGIYLPLITTNCAVLGVVLLNINNGYSFLEMISYSLGSSLGFTLVIYIFSCLREKIDSSYIPKCMKEYPIAFITAGIMSILFTRYI